MHSTMLTRTALCTATISPAISCSVRGESRSSQTSSIALAVAQAGAGRITETGLELVRGAERAVGN